MSDDTERRLEALERKERARQQLHDDTLFYGMCGLVAILIWKVTR